MNAAAKALWNPIVAKEYRSRMRTWRSPLAMTIYIILLGGLGWAVFSALSSTPIGNSGQPSNTGSLLFTYLIIFQVVLLAFITPALTAGAISGERERQTIDLLFVTPIPPFAIIWGKLLASMSFIVLLLILSVPIFSLVFLFGGIELDQMLYSFLVVGVTALCLGLIGIAWSTLFRRTLAATVAAYGTAFVLLVGSLVYGLLFPVEIDPQATTLPAPPAVTLISPVVPLITIATNAPITNYGYRYRNSPSAIPGGGSSGAMNCVSTSNGGTSCYSTAVGTGPVPYNGYGPTSTQGTGTKIPTGLFKGWQYWQASVVMQLVICFAALGLSAFLLPPIRRFRLGVAPAPAAT
jgi:ABC-type transport system involved in multi-copper enzyme maturation permease subunit